MRAVGVVTLLLLSFIVVQAQNWPQWRDRAASLCDREATDVTDFYTDWSQR